MTQIVRIDANLPEPSMARKAAASLKNGNIVAMPTDTVYGLAADAGDQKALDRLYRIKRRAKDKPFVIQISKFSDLKGYIDELSPALDLILRQFWPGPLTIIIRSKGDTVGLRMPDNKVALSIIDEAAAPLAVTSANISGRPSLFCAEEVFKAFNGLVDMVVDDGVKREGIESTILDCTGSPYRIVRKGPLSDTLNKFINLYT